jgi:hypothetical protein
LTTNIFLQTVFKGKKCGVSDTKERISEKQELYGSYFSQKTTFAYKDSRIRLKYCFVVQNFIHDKRGSPEIEFLTSIFSRVFWA